MPVADARKSLRRSALALCSMAAAALASCNAMPERTRAAPVASYHQHLISPTTQALWEEPASFTASDLIEQLDEAGIRRAVVLSVAYTYGDERKAVADEYAKVRAENDWTSAEVARYPDRLVGFCGLSPLRDYALQEIDRCSRLPRMIGLKLHLGNSGVSLRNPEHVRQLAAVFRAANARKLAITVHMRARGGMPYGREDAAIFLKDILPAAPDSVVQIAHMAGAGPGYPDYADQALEVFIEAIKARDRRVAKLVVDVTTVVWDQTTPEKAEQIARRLREIGLRRILFGADLAIGGNPTPAQSWALFRSRLPLTEAEFRTIATNVPAYIR